MRQLATAAGRLYLVALYAFIIAPLVIVSVTSINTATSFPAPFEGVTIKWYRAILAHPEFIAAAWTSSGQSSERRIT